MDFDEMLRRRQAALSLLDDHEMVGDEEPEHSDDIERADDLASAMPTSDDLAFKASLRKNKWLDLDKIAKFSRVQPPSVLHGTLGGQQEVAPGTDLYNPNTMQVALWEGNDEETMPVTVTFGRVSKLVSPENLAFGGYAPWRPFGIARFGTRGFMLEAEVDIGFGCQFSVGASSVALQVGMDSVVGPYTLFRPMKLSGMLSFLPVTRAIPITRTRYADIVLPAAQAGFSIPAFAERFFVTRNVLASGFTVGILDSNLVLATPIQTITVPGGSEMATVELPGDAAAIILTNNGGVPTDFRAIFELGL